MVDLSSLLEWWDEWQLSVLVLGSLGVKCFLAVAAAARKSHIGPVYRFFIWLSYLGGDALAIYALAALLNMQKKAAQEQEQESSDTGSRALQLLWAPIMLMHLGGLANISAYNIEDNELWRRHIATSVSQVAVALYVFCKLWSSSADRRLLAAAILLFIPGVFKCFEKPLALRRSSFYNLVSQPATKLNNSEKDSFFEQEIMFSIIINQHQQKSTFISRSNEQSLIIISLKDYIKKVKADMIVENMELRMRTVTEMVFFGLHKKLRPDKLFVDLARSYSERALYLKYFWFLEDDAQDKAIRVGISNTFNLLYTKDFSLPRKGGENPGALCSLSTWVLCLLVPIAAIGLLHSARKQAYRGSDVKITFVLLYLTLLVDACSMFSSLLYDSPWHGKVAQHNLMALFAHNRRHPWLASAAGLLGCAELLHRLFFRMAHCDSSAGPRGGINGAVRRHVREGWDKFINDEDPESYSRFCDMRGQWTLQLEECYEDEDQSQILAVGRQFDEAVLIWHLATNLFKSKTAAVSSSSSDSDNKDDTMAQAQQISNYMMHLLFCKPEMLMPGSRKELCTLAYNEMEGIFKEEDENSKRQQEEDNADEKQDAAAAVADRLVHHYAVSSRGEEGSFIYAAWQLADALERLGDNEKAWKVMRGVWVEMLCFSAIRCRGYLHAKSLGSGGEYLTFVWLLMAHTGLETFPERQQRPHIPSNRPPAAAAAATQP